MSVRTAECPECLRRVWITFSVAAPLYIAHSRPHAGGKCPASNKPVDLNK